MKHIFGKMEREIAGIKSIKEEKKVLKLLKPFIYKGEIRTYVLNCVLRAYRDAKNKKFTKG